MNVKQKHDQLLFTSRTKLYLLLVLAGRSPQRTIIFFTTPTPLLFLFEPTSCIRRFPGHPMNISPKMKKRHTIRKAESDRKNFISTGKNFQQPWNCVFNFWNKWKKWVCKCQKSRIKFVWKLILTCEKNVRFCQKWYAQLWIWYQKNKKAGSRHLARDYSKCCG